MLCDKPSYSSLYIRGPVGSGKTYLLNLLAHYVQSKGYRTFFIKHSMELNDVKESELITLENSAKASKSKVFLFIDEVHQNTNALIYNYLLKESKYIYTIGAGIPRTGYSPRFQRKLDPTDIFVQESELDECVNCFDSLFPGYNRENINNVVKWTWDYTGGHMYPFVKFTEYLLTNHKDQCCLGDADIEKVVVSLNADDPVIRDIKERAFDDQTSLGYARNVLLSGYKDNTNIPFLSDKGYWDEKKNDFISNLFVTQCLNSVRKVNDQVANWKLLDPDSITADAFKELENKGIEKRKQAEKLKETISLVTSKRRAEILEQILIYGLCNMKESDFMDLCDVMRIENSISYNFGVRIAEIPGLHATFQKTVRGSAKKVGHPATIDFYLNGKLDMYIEAIRNADDTSMKEHVDRFEIGAYKQFKDSYVILNYDFKNIAAPNCLSQIKYPEKVYTYIKQINTLYKGRNVLKRNVSPFVSSPQYKGYCTLARGIKVVIRRVL